VPDFIIPTRDRPRELSRTLAALGTLPEAAGISGSTVVVADNASAEPPAVPRHLPNGVRVELIRLPANCAAASRNAAAHHLGGVGHHPDGWVVMLDDDSHPLRPHAEPLGDILARQHPDVAAVSADIFLPSPRGDDPPSAAADDPPDDPARAPREAGGLPEVFIGCGVALRLADFIAVGGYDPDFDYYAEEYDLAAKLIAAGRRIQFEPGFRVMHRKVKGGRDFRRIIARLIRNNGWVAARYAPDHKLEPALTEIRTRYAAIARRERVEDACTLALAELDATLPRQPRRPLAEAQWDRFTGLTAARDALSDAHRHRLIGRAAIIAPGKNAGVIRRAATELGIDLAASPLGPADTLIPGSMSPGPMIETSELLAITGRRVEPPWASVKCLVGRVGETRCASADQSYRRTTALTIPCT